MTNAIRTVLVCAALAVCWGSPAHAFKTLVTFEQSNGEDVFAGPIQATDGTIYGTTTYGGTANYGVAYSLSAKGKYNVIYNFCAQANCADGEYPVWLTQGADGNLYGQTYQGGAKNEGTIFELTVGGTLTTLYSFCAKNNCTDGALPQSALVQTSDGTFYGTTVIGGKNNQGTIFKFSPSAGLTTLYSFCSQSGCTDGTQPNIGLTLASDGNFYGTAAEGGKFNPCTSGCGTLFRITPAGKFTTLYTFCSQTKCADGYTPQGLLVEDGHGNLYGTTDVGGTATLGTAFKISLKGKFTTLHSFDGKDGIIPYAGLTLATDGNFYGTTDSGGSREYGTVYRMTPSGAVTDVYDFDDQASGGILTASVLQTRDGKIYGGTQQGGDHNCDSIGCGTLFLLKAKKSPGAGARESSADRWQATRANAAIPVSPLGARSTALP